jgi:hypothetical protein
MDHQQLVFLNGILLPTTDTLIGGKPYAGCRFYIRQVMLVNGDITQPNLWQVRICGNDLAEPPNDVVAKRGDVLTIILMGFTDESGKPLIGDHARRDIVLDKDYTNGDRVPEQPPT